MLITLVERSQFLLLSDDNHLLLYSACIHPVGLTDLVPHALGDGTGESLVVGIFRVVLPLAVQEDLIANIV